jgi:hypothetical protein
MIDWYWSHGRQRSGRYALSMQWIVDAYKIRDLAAAIISSTGQTKRAIAVWGPSQAGKSTMLSRFIDDPDGPGSALNWTSDDNFRFSRSEKYPDATPLNPFNTGNDASGSVTKFYLTDSPAHPAFPVEITLASRRHALQALAAGYMAECDLTLLGSRERQWDKDELNEILNAQSGGTPQRDAVELLLDVISAVGRLGEHGGRFSRLTQHGAMSPEIVQSILSSAGPRSSIAASESFACDLFWDAKSRLNDLFARLESYRVGIGAMFGDAPIFCSLPFASLVLDINAYALLAGEGSHQENRSRTTRRLVEGARWRKDTTGAVLIGFDHGHAGEPLFRRPEDFGLFQALTWELAVPLRRDFLQARSEEVVSFLEEFDVFDVPGVAQSHSPHQSVRLKVESESEAKLLSIVLKRGKTATIINRYAEHLLIDTVLILNRAGLYPSRPDQLIEGVLSIWRSLDPVYDPNRGAPPVPIAICLTFMAKIINQMVESGAAQYDLGGLNAMVERLGPLANPNVSTMFTTTYPQWDEGRIRASGDQLEQALESILGQKWFRERFSTTLGQGSVQAVLGSPDGGVAYLLGALSSLPRARRDHLLVALAGQTKSVINDLLEQAEPKRDVGSEQGRMAIKKLLSSLSEALESALPSRSDPALEISIRLRKALSFVGADFESVPRNLHLDRWAIESESYVRTQLDRWINREDKAALAAFGLNDNEQRMLLDSVSKTIDIPVLARWCVENLGHANANGEAQHLTRYLAAKCAQMAAGGYASFQKQPDNGDFGKLCEQKFEEWSAAVRTLRHSPHYELIIQPVMNWLEFISTTDLTDRWEDQPGDEEIEQLIESWEGRGAQ